MPYADDLRGFSEPPSGSYFPALAAISGMQQAPPLAQFDGGDHLRQGMPPQQVRGPIQTIKDAFTPRQDEQGNPKADSLGSILNAALMVVPGMRGSRGAVMAAEKGSGSGGGLPRGTSPEKITGAAVRTDAGIFDGVTHATAADKAAAKGVDISKLNLNDIDGFMTSTGRYVSREEAAKIADAFGQSRKPGAPRLESSNTNFAKGDHDVLTREQAMALPPGRRPRVPDAPYYVAGREGTKSAGQMAGYGSLADAREAAGLAAEKGAGSGGGRAETLPSPPEAPSIRAYHASPHDFEKFDMSKVGTGLGHAYRGEGMNFTTSEAKALAMREQYFPKGHVYEVNLNVNPKSLLNFDKPIAEQPHVQKALDSAGVVPGDRLPAFARKNLTGKDALEAMQNQETPAWRKVLNDPMVSTSQQGTRQHLLKSGIPGAVGADQHVIYSDALINILRKYGVIGALGGGGAATANSEARAQ